MQTNVNQCSDQTYLQYVWYYVKLALFDKLFLIKRGIHADDLSKYFRHFRL
jgi:hypothetical protein